MKIILMNKLSCVIISLVCLLLFTVNANAADAADKTVTLKIPPKALAQWYKPDNKRQVWLHTMFRLRREMLAMRDYVDEFTKQDDAQKKAIELEVEKWSQKFIKDYQSIAEMVPQWQDYLSQDHVEKLEMAVNNQQYSLIVPILKKIDKSCMRCHDDFQTVATLLYRSPDFSEQKVQKLTYEESMEQLSISVNRINIAIKDGYFAKAQKLIQPLEHQLTHLTDTCSNCHKKDNTVIERIIGASQLLLPELSDKLELKDKKQSGRKLGEFAVKVCARCHAVHKLTSDLQQKLQ